MIQTSNPLEFRLKALPVTGKLEEEAIFLSKKIQQQMILILILILIVTIKTKSLIGINKKFLSEAERKRNMNLVDSREITFCDPFGFSCIIICVLFLWLFRNHFCNITATRCHCYSYSFSAVVSLSLSLCLKEWYCICVCDSQCCVRFCVLCNYFNL